MRKVLGKALILALVVLPLVACSPRAKRAPEQAVAIRHLLERQANAWNRGDLDAFMAGYWKSPDLVFTSGGHIRRGWETTLEAYRKHYGSDKTSMGKLEFSDLEVHRLGPRAAWVLGHWKLTRASGTSGGVFTLILRRFPAGWRIVHDHTSVLPAQAPAKAAAGS